MSRAYRIRVRECLKRVVRANDKVSTQLEMLEILPKEQMGELLGEELERRGFKRKGKTAVRQQKDVTVAVNTETGDVTVSSELSEKVDLEGEREGRAYTDVGPGADKMRKDLRDQVKGDLEKQAKGREAELQKKATDELEGQLGDLRKELDQAVNRVTAEALKRKAAQMGQIKELTEDPQSGSLTIVLEV